MTFTAIETETMLYPRTSPGGVQMDLPHRFFRLKNWIFEAIKMELLVPVV